MNGPFAADVDAVHRLAETVARFRAELEAAEPALERLEAIQYPSAAMLRFDLGEAIGSCNEALESLTAFRYGMENASLQAS